MIKINRDDIKLIARHSNVSKASLEKILKKDIYNSPNSWFTFLKLFFFSLGIGFTTAGILFFFAYNWADLHKFIKMGLIEALIIGACIVVVYSKLPLIIKNSLLTCAAILVGVLFAVFGQVYQTGANAYDFFLGWTLSIIIWVLIANFAPLWLLFITLINTTLIMYSHQIAYEWSATLICLMLFTINLLFLVSFLLFQKFSNKIQMSSWFLNILGLATIAYSTIGIVLGIFEHKTPFFIILLLSASLVYSIGIYYGIKHKSSFYLSIISFSIIIIISSYLLNITQDAGMLFLISLFVIGSITFVIKNLIQFQKQWKKE